MTDIKSKLNLNVDCFFKAYSIAIIVGALIFMVFSTGYILDGFLNSKIIDLSDHSIRLLFFIVSMVSFAAFSLIIEVYVIYSYVKTIKKVEEKITVKDIIFLIILHFTFSIYQLILIILGLLKLFVVLLIIAFLLLLPYAYLLIRKIKMRRTRLEKIEDLY